MEMFNWVVTGTSAKLTNPIMLAGKWEVAVRKANLPPEMFPYGSLTSSATYSFTLEGKEFSKELAFEQISESTDYWNVVRDLSFLKNPPTGFSGKLKNGHFNAKSSNAKHILTLRGRICYVLGYDEPVVQISNTWNAAANPLRIPQIRHTYMYSNLVEPSRIGAQEAKVLMHFNPASKEGYKPHILRFVPLEVNVIQDINISIYDGVGFPVEFGEGLFIFDLVFRKVKQLF